jgi:hypothetical protein
MSTKSADTKATEAPEIIKEIAQHLLGEKFDLPENDGPACLETMMRIFFKKAQAQGQAETEKKLTAALDMVTGLAALQFNRSLELVGDNGILDGLFDSLNMLSEKLHSHEKLKLPVHNKLPQVSFLDFPIIPFKMKFQNRA